MAGPEVDVRADARIALDALSLLSKKWHPVVILALDHRGPLGFNDLLEVIPGISGKVLSGTLDELGDAGLVDRTVVRETPLRVEYELTDAGRDMEPIFEALAEWGERHLQTETPTVLIADADRRIAEMYEEWLSDQYRVHRAHNGRELEASIADDPDVAVVGQGLPGGPQDAVLESAPTSCRTIVLVDRPDPSILEFDCDAVLRKPIVRETAIDVIESQLARRGESSERRERASLRAKREFLESTLPRDRLESQPAYADLCSRLEALERRLDE